jgi:hypothetical protein
VSEGEGGLLVARPPLGETSMKQIMQWVGTYVIGPIFLGLFFLAMQKLGSFLDNRRKSFLMKHLVHKDAGTRDLLIELRVELEADRAYVHMFHNGNHYVNGAEMMKISRTHEVVGPGVSYEAQCWSEILTSRIQDEINIIEKGNVQYVPIDDKMERSWCKSTYENQGVQAIARFPLFANKKDLFGYVGVDFGHQKMPENLFHVMQRIGYRIELVLSQNRHE